MTPIEIVEAKVGIHLNFKMVVIGLGVKYIRTLPEMREQAKSFMRAGRSVRLYVWGRLTPQSAPAWIETKRPGRRSLFKKKGDKA